MTQHSKGTKWRVAPTTAVSHVPYKELYQEMHEQLHGLSRPDLMKRCASAWKSGRQPLAPHGSNCVDLDLFQIQPRMAINIVGDKAVAVATDEVFPLRSGNFGPLKLPVPCSVAHLLKEHRQIMALRTL